MKFEWDDEKAERNIRKHGIDFEEVFAVFEDLKSLEFFDINTEHEDRFIRIGISAKMRLLTVVFCERSLNVLRIISARKANEKERELYEKRIRSL